MHQLAPFPSQNLPKTTPGDPIKVLTHTLDNGLQLFMSVNKDEPRIYTEIAVRAGSKHDPSDTTGLAHYFEHMMFKGTDRLGALDWEKEKPILDQIEALFEEHRAEQNPEKKKAIYAEIDRLSFEAAQYAATNEYDKLASAIGAKGTNAYTWVEQTVYVNDIPSNELERWLMLESERFRRPVLRLFHTELETVFEEYNISQDKDFRKTLKAMQEALTPSHPYGMQTTLGRGEDLKNPSQTKIYEFFDTYYVPNNMAIVMAGDFDPAETIALVEKHFGHFKRKPIPPFRFKPQAPLKTRIYREVLGTEAPWVEMGWLLPGAKSREASIMLPLVAAILHNYQAGLFDLNIIQKQQSLEAYAYPRAYEDYSALLLMAKPREGQSLEAVEAILRKEMQNLREGNFEDWLLDAVLKDLKLSEIKSFEKNRGRAQALTTAFVLGIKWKDFVQRWKKWAKVTKAEIVDFAQKHLRDDNFAVVYKRTGEDRSIMKVEKPPITPIAVNRADESAFAHQFLSKKVPDIVPQFVDFKKELKKTMLAPNLPLRTVQDRNSKLFRLHYCYEMGKLSDRRLGLLANYLPYLGTSSMTPSQVQQAFYRIGAQMSAQCSDNHFFFTLTGLEESFAEAIQLMEHLIADAQPNPDALKNLVADVLLRRENDKKNKQTVLSKGMVNYAKYGPRNPVTDRLTQEELVALKPEELTQLLYTLRNTKHDVFYSGAQSIYSTKKILQQLHCLKVSLKPIPPKRYTERAVKKNLIYFIDFPSVQVELLMVSKGAPRFNLEEHIFVEWYNQYFGYGLSSIVFQEIRESKALAYSTYVQAISPAYKNRAHWLHGYVGTQPDKLRDAIEAFQNILEEMPVSVPQIEHARLSILKQIAASRLKNTDLYWAWRNNRERGYAYHDLRKQIYETLLTAKAEDLLQYHTDNIKGRPYTWLILGERSRIDFNYLKQIGKVKELSLKDVFGN